MKKNWSSLCDTILSFGMSQSKQYKSRDRFYIYIILIENLDMRKLCARRVPRLLTMVQKQRREDVSVECLAMFHSNKANFLRQFITMDETWVYHFTLKTKE